MNAPRGGAGGGTSHLLVLVLLVEDSLVVVSATFSVANTLPTEVTGSVGAVKKGEYFRVVLAVRSDIEVFSLASFELAIAGETDGKQVPFPFSNSAVAMTLPTWSKC